MSASSLLATAVAVVLLAAPPAGAQPTSRVPRVGVLGGQTPEGSPPIMALGQGLRELGYVEGQTIALEWRWAQGKNEGFDGLAAELVRLKVDVIVAGNAAKARGIDDGDASSRGGRRG